MPIFVDKSTSFDRLAIRSSTFLGSTTVRLGIYGDSNGYPSNLILDAGTVSVTAATTVYEITISQTLQAGIYWLAFCQQGTAPTTPGYSGNGSATSGFANFLIVGSASAAGTEVVGFQQNTVTGAFANTTTQTTTGSIPYVWIRSAV
jgi:hypothetical protein